VRAIDDHEIGPPGPVTKAIQSTFFEVVRGRDERWTRWLEYAAKAPAGS
jgi:branched-chain amino acid aminotransferase